MSAATDPQLLTADELSRLPPPSAGCERCAALVCPGWEAMPGDFERARLQRLGTLRVSQDEEPTLAEHHPAGTRFWSPQAPIAPAFFPFNRSEVWQCAACARPFLRYTEYGGYYQEERIRALDPALLDFTPVPD